MSDPRQEIDQEIARLQREGYVEPDGSLGTNGRVVSPDKPDLLAGLRTGAWLDAQDFPPLRYHVPGLIPEGSTLLVGPPKIGKSWLVLAVGLAAAHGGSVFGHIHIGQRPVLYLALEDGDRRLQDRCRKLLEGADIPEAFEYLTSIEPGTEIATIEAWAARYPNDEPLVILDTLGKVMPPAKAGESPYQRDYRIGSALKRIADERAGMSITVNHHDRKAMSEDFVDSVSGTHGLAGAADTVVVLKRRRHEREALINVTGRDVAEGEYALHFNGSLWQLEGASLEDAAAAAKHRRETVGLGDRSSEVVALIKDRPQGVSPKDVAESLGMDNQTAGTYLGRLARAGRVSKPKRGLYTPLLNVLKVENGEGEGEPPG